MRSMRRRTIVFAVCALLMMTLISAAFATSVHANSIAEANVCNKTETYPFCFSFQKQSGNQRIGAFGQNHSNPVRAIKMFPQLTVNVKVIIDNYPDYSSVLAGNPGFSFVLKRSTDLVDLSSLLENYYFFDHSKDNFPSPYTFYGPAEITWTGGEDSKTVTFKRADAQYGVAEDLLWFKPSETTNAHFSINQIEIESSSGVTAKPFKCKTDDTNTEVTAFNCIQFTNHSYSANNQVDLVLHLKYNPGIEGKEPPPEPETKYSKTITPYDNQKNVYRLSLSLDTPLPDKEEPEKDVIFVLDVSNSMEMQFGNGLTRLEQLKKVLTDKDCVVDVLAKSNKNRMHVITFGRDVLRLKIDPNVSESASDIKEAIKKINIDGGTNYYNALSETKKLISELDPSSEKTVFFITDGKPTAAYPAANVYYGRDYQYYPASIFARYAAQALTVDRFYSIFVGENLGGASDLQTITQAVNLKASNPESEKFMIQADNSTDLNFALQRFLSFLNNALHDVVIEDQISEYLEYVGNACVTATTKTSSGGVTETTLKADEDYTLSIPSINDRKVTMKLEGYTLPGTTYTLSFDVKANRKALEYYYENADADGDGIVDSAEEIYPDTGEDGTGDYSSGQPGLKSNSVATLKYSYGVNKTETKTYPHPVFQVDTDPANAEIPLTKKLIGRTLEEGEFYFLDFLKFLYNSK